MAETAAPLDTRYTVLTPEHMWFHHRLAGPIRRLEAYGIDFIIRIGIMALVAAALHAVTMVEDPGPPAMGLFLIAYFAVDWGYGVLFESIWSGQTPGKRLFGLRVLAGDGRPVHPEQAVIRNLLRAADMLPFLFLTGLASMLVTRRFQRLGDLAADTIVVMEGAEEARRPAPSLPPPAAFELAARLRPGFSPSRGLRRALGSYLAKRERFREARRRELAAVLAEPLRPRMGDGAAGADPDLLLCALHASVFDPDRVARIRSRPAGGAVRRRPGAAVKRSGATGPAEGGAAP